MAIKLDMSKAYDRVELAYLKAVMEKMGFNERWIHLVKNCVTSVSYNIIHGGYEMGPICPRLGIRQGDPLSPYLFIICAEGFSALIHDYEARKWITGVKVCRQAPVISHMFFADDNYLYCKASTDEAGKVLELLHKFEVASGQKVNSMKSYVFLSSNPIAYNREDICLLLQMPEAGNHSTYLGLPNILGRNKSVILGFLKERVRKRIQNWDGKLLSGGGKEVLLKTVLQSLPTYVMGVFLLPLEFIKELERLMNRFWWRSNGSQSKRDTLDGVEYNDIT